MRTHTFANLMLTAYDILVLDGEKIENQEIKNKENKNKKNNSLNLANQRRLANFSLHQKFFARTDNLKMKTNDDVHINPKDTYLKLFKIIDEEELFSRTERQEFFYKYEQLYNALIAKYVISNLEKKEILKKYTQATIPAIIALDMYKTLNHPNNNNQLHFYSHIHDFILSKHCPNKKSNFETLSKGVRNYLQQYIKNLDFKIIVNVDEIETSINNIKKTSSSKIYNINKVINDCKNEAREIGVPEDEKFEKLRMAYTSIRVILSFEKQTNLFFLLTLNYKKLIENKVSNSEPIFFLDKYIYEKTNFIANLFTNESLYDYVYTLIFHEEINIPDCNCDFDCGKKTKCECAPDYLYGIFNNVEQFIFENQSEVNFEPNDFSDEFIYFESDDNSILDLKEYLDEYNIIRSLEPYYQIYSIFSNLEKNKLDIVKKSIEQISFEDLPLGYLASTMAIINLALKIKLERTQIRNGTLLSYINPILTNQGVYNEIRTVIPAPQDPSPPNNYTVQNPILKDPNNQTVLHSIMIYNRIINKINNYGDYDSSAIYPQSVHGLLDNLEQALKKLNIAILNNKNNLTIEELSELIIKDDVLTKQEINDNLIGILSEATLYNCIDCLSELYKNLKCFGEQLPNILSFVVTSESGYQRNEIVRGALLIAREKIMKNK
ncbi:hypothetical protein [Morganella morganii]|uniref:hypothetical protein n=1 Tax=Morganella morganii TaxID=582 RepID=UPI0004A7EFB8|nr:hypothetical protein [Morganella morganii]